MRWHFYEKSDGELFWISSDCRFTILYSPKDMFKYSLFDQDALVEKYRPFGMAKAAAVRRIREEQQTNRLLAGVS